jgi:hypothetical protein
METKVTENRLRRLARKYDLRLLKSHARNPENLSFGGYELVDVGTNGVVFGYGNAGYDFNATLEDVAEYLS